MRRKYGQRIGSEEYRDWAGRSRVELYQSPIEPRRIGNLVNLSYLLEKGIHQRDSISFPKSCIELDGEKFWDFSFISYILDNCPPFKKGENEVYHLVYCGSGLYQRIKGREYHSQARVGRLHTNFDPYEEK